MTPYWSIGRYGTPPPATRLDIHDSGQHVALRGRGLKPVPTIDPSQRDARVISWSQSTHRCSMGAPIHERASVQPGATCYAPAVALGTPSPACPACPACPARGSEGRDG